MVKQNFTFQSQIVLLFKAYGRQGTLKKYTKSFDTEEAWKKWKDEGNQPQWANEY